MPTAVLAGSGCFTSKHLQMTVPITFLDHLSFAQHPPCKYMQSTLATSTMDAAHNFDKSKLGIQEEL